MTEENNMFFFWPGLPASVTPCNTKLTGPLTKLVHLSHLVHLASSNNATSKVCSTTKCLAEYMCGALLHLLQAMIHSQAATLAPLCWPIFPTVDLVSLSDGQGGGG